MLKKLIKFGNSNALVLDQSIMKLVGLSAGDYVKLRVMNDELIIKKGENPQKIEQVNLEENAQCEKKRMIEEEQLYTELNEYQGKWQENLQELAHSKTKLTEADIVNSSIDTARSVGTGKLGTAFTKLVPKMQKLMKKYEVDIQEMAKNKPYLEALNQLKKDKDNMDPEDFKNAVMEVRYQYFPELKAFDIELHQLSKSIEDTE
ncbi:AbrB/MazE/SpoVT family DNA-binding domain-containing protein [Candidatus Comchoanobacter bicostacola]|uniref:AbrB/MazE/SpoVT family DNA-binding domain-containing protein n=1 Tax=Candidatus Comchoanobacter bicostacola TaxID=2919598 RepID=A0ABY5DJL8_9GAMM|nr:AbrB/MazE/SpoVT family DNA-binding domain-containing protein [Candidatus Comchoanobacter bicostacola]UTC24721.1 AbrB/MazE/SpoVT family DNA-binding domain-containing protein [Candidatus Comchoanobacter bicostacola]